jgi:uncharacterized protein (TIRG00374 family)
MQRKKLSKQQLLLVWSLIIGAICLVIVFLKIPVKESFSFFLKARFEYVLLFLLISLVIMISNSWRWWLILRSQGHKIPFFSLIGYKYAGFSISFLTPGPRMGGEAVSAGLLAKHKIKFTKALSSVIIDKSIDLSLSGVFFLIGAVTILVNFALPENLKILIIIVAVMMIMLVVYFYQQMLTGQDFFMKLFKVLQLHKLKNFNKYESKIKEFEDHIRVFYQRDKKEFIYACLLTALSWAFMFLEYKTALLMLGFNVSYLHIFFIFSFVGLAYLMPLPMAIGSLEAGQISAFSIFGMPSAGGVALSMLIRARDLLWSLIGLLVLSYYGVTSVRRRKKKKNELLDNISE